MLQFKEIIETPKLPRHSSWWVNVNLWPQLYGTYLVCTNWSPEEHIQLLSWPSWLALLVNALSASGSSRRKPGRINGPNVKNFLPLHSVLCACTSGFNQTHNLTRNRLVCQSKKASKLPVFSSNWAQILCVCVCLCVAQWDRAAEKFRKSAGWRTKEGYVWWDWWCWRQTVWAHDCSSPSLIFLSRFCCARASFCGFHPAFALQCSLWCTQFQRIATFWYLINMNAKQIKVNVWASAFIFNYESTCGVKM